MSGNGKLICIFIVVKKSKFILSFILCCVITAVRSQPTTNPPITVRGNIFDKNDSNLSLSPIIINKHTGTGQYFSSGAGFTITGNKSDTFLITAGGYEVRRICFLDSALKTEYFIRIALQVKINNLTQVAIYPVKELDQIQKERAAIAKEQTRQTIGITDAVSSPITYLYERFSRDGKSREAVAILENEDNKREILKELFRTYNRAGVIVLEESEYDSFINYLNIPENFLRSASDYDLAVLIRYRYLQYRNAQEMHNRNQR
ncbi:hypothetical protein BH09BAC5_BH09BAC5_08990 [soil metagenome]